MSTIAYRDGKMAADSRAYAGSSDPIGSKQKIFRLDDGTLIGVSTTRPGVSEAFVEWYERVHLDTDARHMDDPHPQVFSEPNGKLTALVVTPDESVYLFEESCMPSGPLEAPFFAIGSGNQYALGALEMGASVEEAIACAIKCDVWSGGEVRTLNLKG